MNTTNRVAALLSWKTRRRLLNARVAVRAFSDPRRPLPDALIIGAQRAGTSSLHKWLEAHPDVAASVRKGTEYFGNRFTKPESWYRAHFASRLRHWTMDRLGRPLVTFEATPSYLSHPLAPERAAKLAPKAKLIVLLRDPVERAISHYLHERRGDENRRSSTRRSPLNPSASHPTWTGWQPSRCTERFASPGSLT